MELGASLAQVELFAPDPRGLAAFYASTFCLDPSPDGEALHCAAAQRSLRIVQGEAGQLRSVSYRFHGATAFEARREALRACGLVVDDTAERFSALDPEGRLITFLAPGDACAPSSAPAGPLPARLQHFGVRTPAPAPLVDFSVNQLGFVLSDRVVDAQGDLTAAFLRTDAEHHSMAIFRAAAVRFDHFSCEAPSWAHLREWADHMAAVGVALAWGIGRHGPGNDTFLMVRDPDGNMGEISSDLEVCAPDRRVGVWPHAPQTLNRWGVAIMRS
jgi:catechol 2,3-dioxygenase-like lactoylglutathione lyase family enzyme